jgi:potassium-transporting ATPase potassium-binding subunit
MSHWIIAVLVPLTAVLLSVPLGLYLAWILDGRYRAPRWLAWIEGCINTGPMNWKTYALSLLAFNVLMFVFSIAVLALQPIAPLNPDGKGELAASTIYNSACSFVTNTNLQHYSGEVHLSYFSQLFFVCWNMFVSAAVGFAASAAVVRGLRGDAYVGNFYLDVWRGVVYVLMPPALLTGVLLIACGMPMTFEPAAEAVSIEKGSMGSDEEGKDKPQVISRGPVAAVLPIKHLGTNGGGFFGANSAHPFENPNAWSNWLENVSLLVLSLALVVMFGRFLGKMREAAVIYGVMLFVYSVMLGWGVWQESRPNPALLARASYEQKTDMIDLPSLPGLPVDQDGVGNLEGKELRFGPGAGATWAASTTATSCGAVNCMHDSLNPLTGLTPMTGMWLLCIIGGKGVGLINFLVYLFVAVFFAGLMVGRTPEYLGKKVEAREMKLAMLALLIHPVLILTPTAMASISNWGKDARSNPGAHGFSQMLYEFSSSAANNGSGFEGLADTHGFVDAKANASDPSPVAYQWDVATGLVMLLGRFVPIIAPLALAGSLAGKKRVPFTVGTLRTDTITFGCILLGTILLVGALLFMPAAMLGPVAEHLGPMPFGR